MYTNSKLAKSVRLALMYGATATAFTGASVAVAQEQTDTTSGEGTERIQVTGSRLQRTDIETASPVTVIGRDEINAGGFSNLGELLTTLNQADAIGLTNVTSATNGNDGTQTISLRGLGSTRSLVLVDGRRWLALGGGQVDISQIPTAVVERIEVLADGASAIYGSDAIAGVINIITRSDFQGAEVDTRYSVYGEGDGENFEVSASVGAQGDRSSIFFNINKVEQKAIGAGDREISATPDYNIPVSVTGSAFGQQGVFLTGGEFVHLDPDFDISGGQRPTADDYNPGFFRYNFAPQNYLLTPSERLSMFVKADYELTSNVRAFAQATYNQRKSRTEIAEVPLTMGFSGPQWEIPISADNVYNPFGEEITASGMRMSAAGPRTNVQDYDTYFVTGGFEGDFILGDGMWGWDVSYSRGESSRHALGTNYVSLLNLRSGLGPSFLNDDGVATCGDPDNVITGCVPIDMFQGSAGMTPEMVNYMTYAKQENARSGVTNLSANIAGDLFELPAGFVSVAAGVEFRTDKFQNNPDSLVAAGLSSDNFVEATQGQQSADEVYVELGVPVLRDLPFADSVDLNLAWRRSEFDNGGLVGVSPVDASFDNDSFKIGGTWRVNEELMLRANFAETFRAPSVSNLYAGGSESFQNTTDLCSSSEVVGDPYNNQLTSEQRTRCDTLTGVEGGAPQTTSQIRTLSGGNPNLQPESGDTMTVGFVYNPNWLDGFDISVDWWKIELDDVMATIGGGTILEDCVIEGIDASCGLVERTATGEAQTIRSGQQNMAYAEVEGIDFNTNYSWDTAEWGRFSLGARTTYNISTAIAVGEDSELTNRVGNISGPFGGPAWRWRSNLGLTWAYQDWSVNWSVRHTSNVTETCSATMIEFDVCSDVDVVLDEDGAIDENNSTNSIGTTVYHDISVSYALPWDASVRVGGRNVFQKNPPHSYTSFANTFNQAYDIPGGQYFVSYNHRF